MNNELGIKDRESSHNSLFIIHYSFHAVIITTAIIFAIGASVLSWGNVRATDLAPRFHWPDETSNAYFAERVARGESFIVSEERNRGVGNIVHPRTVNVRSYGALVPGSYLGLPLWYGLIGRAFGVRAMLFITPILAAIGLLAFAFIIRTLFGGRIALVSAIILAFHPSVWFFTATAFLPNIPFVALLLAGFGVLIGKEHSNAVENIRMPRMPDPNATNADMTSIIRSIRIRIGRFGCSLAVARWFLGSLLIGLALTMRTHEILWVLALVLVAVVRYCSGGLQAATWRAKARRYTIPAAIIFIGIVLPFIPVLILNTQLYGSPFVTGYSLLQEGGSLPTEFSGGSALLPPIVRALVAPFGWHPVRALTLAWQYLIVSYPWFTVLAAVGVFMGVMGYSDLKLETRNSKLETNSKFKFSKFKYWDLFRISDFGFRISARVIFGTIILVAWLLLFYGSWIIADPLVRATNVLTISYMRYWLPIIIVCAFWAAMGFEWLTARIRVAWRPYFATVLVLAVAVSTFPRIVNDPTEGLRRQWSALQEHRTRARAVVAATEPNAVIVSDRMDKVFFPERAVVHASSGTALDQEFIRNLRALVERAPVYWYSPSVVAIDGFQLVEVAGAPYGERLYVVQNP